VRTSGRSKNGLWLATAFVSCALLAQVGQAEDGYRLWLRYDVVPDASRLGAYRQAVSSIVVQGRSDTERALREELGRGVGGLLATTVPSVDSVSGDGAVVAGTPSTSSLIAALGWASRLKEVGPEGYVIRSTKVGGRKATVIASESAVGALYGAFHLLRLIQTGQPIAALDVSERPRIARRLLDHWDNLDGTIERGYAGASLWRWTELLERVDPRIADYARANASIGINGAVLNNVNASPKSLTPEYLRKTAAVANALRPYGIRVYLSANFGAPKALGELPTADPLDPDVAAWWRRKADEIYRLIPDFGGFLVKASSEGQPGPDDYKRSHAEGANMLADALAPHGGIVMWRAFVYDAAIAEPDRAKRPYALLQPQDGQFRKNVLIQAKNGPVDFQPREPFHPLFGAMPKTPLMAELQITQEYLGQSTHMVYLAPMWKEFLDADTYRHGPGSLVAKVVDGTLDHHELAGIAGVANTGSDRNWCGHPMAQANWYAYGRLAWDHRLSAETIADEWMRMTWSQAPDVIATMSKMMLDSREAYVDYTMPLGLHHLIGGDHYAPMPENDRAPRPDWTATYYHRAAADGIGFDRTRSGSDAVDQYQQPLSDLWNDVATCPEPFLLWFHRRGWDDKLKSGRTLWEELGYHYARGAQRARRFEQEWRSLEGRIDTERYDMVAAKLKQQALDAEQWAGKCMTYFQHFSQRAMPAEAVAPSQPLR
jgi:alpha-glucuronidase